VRDLPGHASITTNERDATQKLDNLRAAVLDSKPAKASIRFN